MNNWLKIVQEWGARCLALPCSCVLCLKPSQRSYVLCAKCESRLPFLGNACHSCALPLKHTQALCHKCQLEPPKVDVLQALFRYEWPMSAFIAQFKYAEKLEFGKLLAHLMTRLQPTTPVDCVIPIPLHPKRQQERGFNQTLELAIPLAKKLEIPLNRWDCTRTLSTAKQTSLNAKMRTQNVTDSTFAIAPHFKAKHVLVIEDIVTTGSTINAFATVLKRAGVKTVEVWSCCRTMIE